MEDELIWKDDPKIIQDSEWSKISLEFTNAGYREGITAGKESALQQGFDEGFERVGTPLGRELGILRGLASALLSFLETPGSTSSRQDLVDEAREIVSQLREIRFSDIAPPDLEAERHAREHIELDGEDDGGMDLIPDEELKKRQDMEKLEDIASQMGVSSMATRVTTRIPGMDDVRNLRERLLALCDSLGIPLRQG
ncbi:hypothetical protein AcW1_007704 [Taiwanofungus camphoratus]|nr:hypothetical protein AcV7_009905 [Antrodia cinnamomea]KAI0953502.1 hypothetical protein AcW1_007704 [Antrodia cinnamomea]